MGNPQVSAQDVQNNPYYQTAYKVANTPSDYSTFDFTKSAPALAQRSDLNSIYQDFTNPQLQQNFSAAQMKSAADQALQGVQGVGGQYGALGLGNSGAAQAAAAQAAATPFAQAQTNIAGLENQNQQNKANAEFQGNQAFYNAYSGIIAPSLAPQMSAFQVNKANQSI